MDAPIKQRIAFALKCKPAEVPEKPEDIDKALKERIKSLKKAKHG